MKILSKIKTAYIFNLLAVLLLLGLIFIYSQFEDTKTSIVETNLNSQLEYTQNITNKLAKSVEDYIKNNNLYTTLKNNKKLREEIEEHLNMFITKRYRYVYIVDKESIDDTKFRILLDGTENEDEKSEFGELFIPLNIKKWNDSYNNENAEFFKHTEDMNLWMTFLNPIIINNKIQGLVVIDFALEDHKHIINDLHQLDENFEAILIFFIIIFFILVWFSYFDLKREKEKEIIQEKLKNLNNELENKIEQEIQKGRKKDQQMIQQSRLAQMGEMISMIAHQWRQPLAAISSTSGAINLKARRDKLDKELAIELSKKISDYSQHLSATIDDFRGFFKPNKEKQKTTYFEIVNGVLTIVDESITNKNIKLIKELNCEASFDSYQNELKQVVLNLIKNAEDILIEKDIQDPYIKIKTYMEDKKYILEISDNGGGVPKDIIDKIFDPYFSTKTQKDGTGLGLYMSKTIIEDHCNGELSVFNGKDGAIFKIVIQE
jgi:signal transduction histidine kinase